MRSKKNLITINSRENKHSRMQAALPKMPTVGATISATWPTSKVQVHWQYWHLPKSRQKQPPRDTEPQGWCFFDPSRHKLTLGFDESRILWPLRGASHSSVNLAVLCNQNRVVRYQISSLTMSESAMVVWHSNHTNQFAYINVFHPQLFAQNDGWGCPPFDLHSQMTGAITPEVQVP